MRRDKITEIVALANQLKRLYKNDGILSADSSRIHMREEAFAKLFPERGYWKADAEKQAYHGWIEYSRTVKGVTFFCLVDKTKAEEFAKPIKKTRSVIVNTPTMQKQPVAMSVEQEETNEH